MALVLAPPVTPHTPVDLFAALALMPTLGPASPCNVPSLTLSPPSPTKLHPLQTLSKSGTNGSNDTINSPTITDLIKSLPLPPKSPEIPKGPTHRALAPNEARQLTLLLTQYLFPVRNSGKGMMRESINLAEKLHEAGIRWDSRRRVMGMHLRGIWEEGQRLGRYEGGGGHGAMDLYIQGSFLTIAEEPHPLDTMPIPIQVNHESFAALPKLTLQAGLASIQAPMRIDITSTNGPQNEPKEFTPPPTGALSAAIIPHNAIKPNPKTTWRDKKKSGLAVRTDAKYKNRAIAIPYSAASAKFTSSRERNTFGKSKKRMTIRVLGNKAGKLSKNKFGASMIGMPSLGGLANLGGWKKWRDENGKDGLRTARKVSFGGWEVR